MDSTNYFIQLLDQQVSDQVTQVYSRLAVEQAALRELIERVSLPIDPITDTKITRIEESADDDEYVHNDIFQNQADERVYYSNGSNYYPNYKYQSRSYSYAGDDSFHSTKKVLRFFDYVLTPEETATISDDSLRYFVVRDPEGKLTVLEDEVKHFGTDPYHVNIHDNDDIHLAVIRSVFHDERHCFFLQGRKVRIIRLQGEFCYLRQANNNAEVVHCSSGKLLQHNSIFSIQKGHHCY